ncbi:hypothetical protein [Streptomyces sp. NPDC005799]|uniref:hypothetical protein n=1 Tax=Streptomyces sp. NPDC005799 TaxID=3154678 RepID=UPI0033E457C6
MSAPRGRRGYQADAVIVDEVNTTPLRTVTFDEDGVEHVVLDWPAIEWPRKSGKKNLLKQLSGEITFEVSTSEALLAALRPLFAEALSRRERMLARLAADLRIPVHLARQRFNTVLQVLENAGLADGYGHLTITQPVRPPVLLPTRR